MFSRNTYSITYKCCVHLLVMLTMLRGGSHDALQRPRSGPECGFARGFTLHSVMLLLNPFMSKSTFGNVAPWRGQAEDSNDTYFTFAGMVNKNKHMSLNHQIIKTVTVIQAQRKQVQRVLGKFNEATFTFMLAKNTRGTFKTWVSWM